MGSVLALVPGDQNVLKKEVLKNNEQSKKFIRGLTVIKPLIMSFFAP